jgi:hypothetical protein
VEEIKGGGNGIIVAVLHGNRNQPRMALLRRSKAAGAQHMSGVAG